jgi:hypothetical protein
MARILLGYRKDTDPEGEIPSYSLSTLNALIAAGHEVTCIGENHKWETIEQVKKIKSYDLFIDLDCGRNKNGELHFLLQSGPCPIPSAVRFIDTHGYPSLHRRIAKNYSHVFFAVWSRRDIFSKHNSVHWCPNASDVFWFDTTKFFNKWDVLPYSFGFFGSKGGLDRADDLRSLCDGKDAYLCDIREIGRNHKRRWPRTAEQMANCKVLFNKGQKHDGPNQRVIESMLMNRPLINNRDKTDGMRNLFEEGEHYVGYESKAELAIQMEWCLREKELAQSMARRAYDLAINKHQVKHRVEQILKICET